MRHNRPQQIVDMFKVTYKDFDKKYALEYLHNKPKQLITIRSTLDPNIETFITLEAFDDVNAHISCHQENPQEYFDTGCIKETIELMYYNLCCRLKDKE